MKHFLESHKEYVQRDSYIDIKTVLSFLKNNKAIFALNIMKLIVITIYIRNCIIYSYCIGPTDTVSK